MLSPSLSLSLSLSYSLSLPLSLSLSLSIFNQVELRQALHPYLFLTQAVRNGSIQKFNEVVEKYGSAFKADKNHTLVQRLGHNVLKTGKSWLKYYSKNWLIESTYGKELQENDHVVHLSAR